MLSHYASERRELKRCSVLPNKLVSNHLRQRVIAFSNHRRTDSCNVLLVSAGNNCIRRELFRGFLYFIDWSYFLHSASQELDCNLFFGEFGFSGVGCSRLSQDYNSSDIVVVRSSCTSHHLVELLNGEPVDSHRQSIEDDLTCREIHTCRECGGCYNTGKFPFLELLLNLTAFLRCETCMIWSSHRTDCLGKRVTAGSRIREDDGLSFVSLRRYFVELLEDQLFDVRDLCFLFGED